MFVYYFSSHLERVCQLAAFHRERIGQQREALDLLIVGELLLQCFDALHYHLVDEGVATEVFAAGKLYAVLTGVFLEQLVFGDDEGGDELALVGDDDNLVDELVHEELCLYHLRGDVFAVCGLSGRARRP